MSNVSPPGAKVDLCLIWGGTRASPAMQAPYHMDFLKDLSDELHCKNDFQLDRWLILWHSTSKICLYKFLFFNKSINFGLGKDNVDNNIYAGYDSWMEYILHIMCEHKLALKQKLESLFCRKCQKFYENIGRQILFPWSTNLFLLKWVDRQIFSCRHHLSFPELAKCVYPNTQKTLCDSLTWKIPSCMEMSKLWAGIRPLCLSLT